MIGSNGVPGTERTSETPGLFSASFPVRNASSAPARTA
jgi:hypothetical protein